MNVLLWLLQVALALFCLAGGQYKIFHFHELAKVPSTAALALEALALAVLFAQYSLALTATNPLLYVAVMALVAAFVAYGRFMLRTPA